MKKENWIWIAGLGALGLALFFAYKKPNAPAPSEKEKAEGVKESSKQKKGGTEMAFSGSNKSRLNPEYIRPTNLIPDVYGRYHNADGGSSQIVTTDICSACQSADKIKHSPAYLGGFK